MSSSLFAVRVFDRKVSAALLCAAGLLLGACDKPAPVAAENQPKDAAPAPLAAIPHSRTPDDTARFFAALPGTEGSPFADLEKGEVWQAHKSSMDASWAKTDLQLLQGLREFSSKQLDLPIVPNRTVFYSFSGPDTMTATYYFPKAPTYVMIGLEPVGTIPTIKDVEKKKDLPGYLTAMRVTMASILGRSFFVTKEMDQELRGQTTDGILLPMLHLLVRTGHTILGVRYVRVDDTGNVVDRPAVYKTDSKFANRGVEVEFQTSPGAPSQHAFYFSVNLDNQHMSQNAGFNAYLSHVKNVLSMFKATSYMTHRDEFSMIRDYVMNNSDLVIQDDSGIPYHFFTADKWKVSLFGDYDKPYGSFRYLAQKDLKAAFHETKAPPLPMHIGYGYRMITSNLELAVRNDAQPLPGSSAAPAQK